MTESAFRDGVLAPRVGRVGKRINLERIELPPLLTVDDHFFFSVLSGAADVSPPFRTYRANRNFVSPAGNPFAAKRFFKRWYQR
jgi:hypothetical protein